MKLNKKVKIKGEVTAKFYDQSTLNFLEKIWNKIVIALNRKDLYIRGDLSRTKKVYNLVTYAGIEAMFQRMTQEYGSNLYINYAALGSDDTAATVNDTALGTETYRNEIASATAEDNVMYVDAFYTQDETDGTYKEFGFYIDGSAASDSGTLWNRVVVDWTKSDTESLYISGKWTLTNA